MEEVLGGPKGILPLLVQQPVGESTLPPIPSLSHQECTEDPC